MNTPLLTLDFARAEVPQNIPIQLLDRLRRRGIVVEADGAKLLLDAPQGALEDLLPDVQRFKPQLLELLKSKQHPRTWRDRDVACWARVGASVSPGAATICSTLQSFPLLFDSLHRGELPKGNCTAIIDDEALPFEDVPGILRAIEIDWTERARSCNATKRDLTPDEYSALDRAHQLLEHLTAAYSP